MSARVETSLEVQAERLRMALAEAGYPATVRTNEGFPRAHYEGREAPVAVWARALDVVGVTRRCLPCLNVDVCAYGATGVSPDCEGTGRCAS